MILVREKGTLKNCLVFMYNIGSILSVIEKSGAKVFGASYDTWGKQTVTLNTICLHRGYMGHEMLGELDIIKYEPMVTVAKRGK